VRDLSGTRIRKRVDGEVITTCRGCGDDGLEIILFLGEMPLANGLLSADQLDEPEFRYPLDVAFCGRCALVQLTVSLPPEALFSEYLYFSSYSDTVVENAVQLVRRMIQTRGLGPDSLAIEVASNDGYLLQHYVRGGVPVLGIDPATNIVPVAQAHGVPTLPAFFGSDLAEELRSAGRRADVLHANNVLAHVPDLNGMVRGIARVLADDGVAVIETPYVRDLVEGLEFDTIYHEHVFFYSLTSLDAVFRRCGLQIVDVERISLHGGSLRVFAALEGAAATSSAVDDLLEAESRAGVGSVGYYRGFAGRVESLCADLRGLLTALKSRGHQIGGYGAAAKGAVLLNALDLPEGTLEFVADRSPHKQGRYMPGVHVPVVSPDRLLELMPDHLLLLAWNFADEIMDQQAEYRRRGGRFIIPVPVPRII
jgi:SAM-dependent methyltransferase